MSENIASINDDTFESEVLQSNTPVLVDFWAEWCGPCKMLAPVLDEIVSTIEDKVKIVKLDVDANPETPPKYGIRSIPTLILFKDGNVEATKSGVLSLAQLSTWLEDNL